ncbi:hypothetical protein [Bauldia litoralis]|uniref:Lipoprotein n=1 Tax=Bauldia litoralis TaxID=665467 RepID=A0A1G6A9T9_9HYPH|nr:hypothetical protein [Bauldia litoralis]SDB05169.1 hypothetical protein SAMN02982931_00355 [Bauldia litoralis]
MKIVSTSVTALTAFGIIAGASVAASACEWHKSHVTAAARPAPVKEEVAAPATTIDPMQIADMGGEALVPRKPEVEALEAAAK